MTSRRPGNLTVITGPMFAGKTAALTARVPRGGAAVLALKPAFDTRAGKALIRSRDGSAIPAMPIASWPTQAAMHATLLLDEAQFMATPHYAGDVVADVLDAVRGGASVTVSGLDTDYLRQPFEIITRLRVVADEQVVLRARCHVCGKAAAWTAKRTETGQLFEVGDSDLYEARCDAHWCRPGQTEASNPHAAAPDITDQA